MADDDRVVVLEERVAWLQKLTDDLSTQMAAQDKRIRDLESTVLRLTEALRSMGDGRSSTGDSAFPEDDPVPKSG